MRDHKDAVRRFLPHLIDLVLTGQINPGHVFDQVLPIEDVAEGVLPEARPVVTEGEDDAAGAQLGVDV